VNFQVIYRLKTNIEGLMARYSRLQVDHSP